MDPYEELKNSVGKTFQFTVPDKHRVKAYVLNFLNIGDSEGFMLDIVVKHDTVTLTPLNLYTFLRVSGVDVPYSFVKELDTFETDMGIYSFKEGKCLFLPPVPLKYIKINLEIHNEQ